MVVEVNRSIRIAPVRPGQKPEPSASAQMAPSEPRFRILRSVAKRVWHALVVAISGPGLGEEYRGIDETAMPSGFVVPYKRGSRQVRNLSHLLF
jgi:hypothetical protein